MIIATTFFVSPISLFFSEFRAIFLNSLSLFSAVFAVSFAVFRSVALFFWLFHLL